MLRNENAFTYVIFCISPLLMSYNHNGLFVLMDQKIKCCVTFSVAEKLVRLLLSQGICKCLTLIGLF